MALYDIDGNIISLGGGDSTPYLSSASGIELKEQSDFSMSSFDIIKTFTPFATDYSTGTSTPMSLNITYAEFLNTFYEPYLGNHSGLMVTKKNLGKDQSGNFDIWCYDFIPYNAKKKILLSSGMHPYEFPASFGLALWLKNYMESSDSVFAYMRENVQLSIIPIINPWGFNPVQKVYGNVNGVNINRNFDDWTGAWEDFPSSGTIWNKKGDAPFSEAETQIIANWVKANNDADFYIDCHTGVNNSSTTYGDVWYTTVSTNVNLTKIQTAASALMAHLQSTYSATPKLNAVIDADASIKSKYSTTVVAVPAMVIEQPQYDDTVYTTVPNNCSTAIKEYATNVHAYIVAQLKA